MKLNPGANIDAVFYETVSGENFFTYRDKQIEFSKIKLTGRDGKGTKLRL